MHMGGYLRVVKNKLKKLKERCENTVVDASGTISDCETEPFDSIRVMTIEQSAPREN